MSAVPRTLHPLLAAGRDEGAASGEATRLFETTDWAATPLGPPERWPQNLRIAVSICLNSRFPMFVWWGPTLVNIYNDAYIPMLGKRHPSAFGRPATDSWRDIWDVVGPQADAVMRDGRATWNERVLLQMERNGYAEDTWFTWSYSPIHGEGGSVDGLFCACVEETARVLAERERDVLVRDAQDAAHTLQTWFDNAPGFVALLRGRDFVFELVNQAFYQLVGHRDLVGRAAFDALPDLRDQGLEQLLVEVVRSGTPYVGRGVRIVLQPAPGGDPQEAFIDFVYAPVRDAQGRVAGIFVQGNDVTEQVRAVNALKAADQRKDEFLATLSHELRNPLAPIRQAASLARADGATAQQRSWALDVIDRQAGHMALLLDDLLDVSRISRSKLTLRIQRADLQEVVQAALETARPLVERKKHVLRVELPPQRVSLHVDPVRIAQVLSNLLSNAAKYTDAGGHITLTASVHDDRLELRVRDDGIGLSAEAQQEIFTMFSQVSTALDRSEGGLGIGLALSRGLVALHGGTLQARSEGPGRGAEFIVVLPDAVEQTVAPPRAAEAPAAASQAGRSVVIADDNLDALQTMAVLLEMEGHRVHQAADGEQALARVRELQPEVAVLDIGMPGLNGYEVARRIRAEPWGRGIQLIALTGWGQAEDVERARAAGFDHHVTKPVDFGALQRLVS